MVTKVYFNFVSIIIIAIFIQSSFVESNWWYLGLRSLNSNKQQLSSFNNSFDKNDDNFYNTTKILKKTYCNDINVLKSPMQRKLCNINPKIIEIISDAASMAINECQHQFKYRRWNCTIFNTTNVYGRILSIKSRETAFIYAINSAAVMYRITQACTKGELEKCNCDQTVQKKKLNGNYEWGGCSQNVLFGHKFSRKFVDSSEAVEIKAKNNVEDRLMNLHNNEVGRRAILKNMKQVCKCHGVSGSCTMKICWKIMPDFRVIGDNLVKNFNDALQVHIDKRKIVLKVKKTRSTILRRKPRKDDLVFVARSPNFCEKNRNLGSLGTRGRRCILLPKSLLTLKTNSTINRQSSAESCSNLCCGRGYRTKVVEYEEDCDCQFQWCCSVKCKKCKKRILEYYCN